jgi:molybdopterin synthase catalytic subunit
VVTFVGTVRGDTDGRQVLYLEYEAYPEMAEQVLAQVADEVRARWTDVQQVAIVHRVGRLDIGEVAVVIALSAAHRRQTFDALRYAIDRIKEIAPIWKKEVWADGAEWKSEQ